MVAGAAFIIFYWFRARAKLFRPSRPSGVYLFHMFLVISVRSFLYAPRSMVRTWSWVIYITISTSLCPGQESCASEGLQNIIGRILVHRYSGTPDKHANQCSLGLLTLITIANQHH